MMNVAKKLGDDSDEKGCLEPGGARETSRGDNVDRSTAVSP